MLGSYQLLTSGKKKNRGKGDEVVQRALMGSEREENRGFVEREGTH